MVIDFLKMALTIYTFLPAYFANAAPVVFGGGLPIDLNRNFLDGRRIFGQNKTVKGAVSGMIAGTVVGLIQKNLLLGSLLSSGAILGDLASSFIKRRLSLSPGEPLPVVDQLDFVLGALLLSSLFFRFDEPSIFYIIVITPFIHVITNFIAYSLNLKKVPY